MISWLVLGYGAVRVFDIVTYHLGVLFAHPTSADFALRSLRRSVVLALHNYGEVLFWFAAAYRRFAVHFSNSDIVGSVDGALYYSVVTMTTVGYGDITPSDALSRWIAVMHISVSLFLTLIVLGRLVSLLPKPKSLDPNENNDAF